MTVRIVNGKLLLGPDGKLATTESCCCVPCSGPCENSEDCAPGCVCVDGECVESGACCLPGGTCQSGLTQAECESQGGEHYAGSDCDTAPCGPTGACCTYDAESETWSCAVVTENECTGRWQGAYTTCEDGDCSDTCCETYNVGPGGCTVSICEPGHFGVYCETSPGCSADGPQPDTAPTVPCQSGTAPETTVTVSGVLFNTGDAALDAFLDDAINTSYSISRVNCDGTASNGSHQTTFDLGSGWYVLVTFPSGTFLQAGLNVFVTFSSPPQQVLLERSQGPRSAVTSACGSQLYDCDQRVSGAPTTTGGLLVSYCDFTNADITTS